MDICPICGQRPEHVHSESNRDVFHVKCPTCGEYSLSWRVQMSLPTLDQNKKYILSGVIREETEYGNRIELLTTNIADILASASLPDGPLEAMDRILLYVHRHTTTVASYVQIKPSDYPIACAKGPEEFNFYLTKLVELGYLEDPGEERYRLSLDGWKRLGEISRERLDSSQAFVAMWFSNDTKEAWLEGIEPALSETGYKPIRIDLVQHNEKIDDRIIAEIRRSGLLVADFTGNRGGVYFEAGFAMGLDIPVIWTCREDHVKYLHFDTRQYNHIVWKTPEELKASLIDRIEATLPRRGKRRFVTQLLR